MKKKKSNPDRDLYYQTIFYVKPIKGLSKIDIDLEAEVCQGYNMGQSTRQLAKKHHISRYYVEKILSAWCVSIRDEGGSWQKEDLGTLDTKIQSIMEDLDGGLIREDEALRRYQDWAKNREADQEYSFLKHQIPVYTLDHFAETREDTEEEEFDYDTRVGEEEEDNEYAQR